NDVGEDTFEKVDRGVAGGNYGWSITENATGDPRFQQPVYVYTHGPNDVNGCAVTGGTFYDPPTKNFPANNPRGYFFADFCGCWIHKLDPATGKVTSFATNLPKHPVGLAVAPNGGLLVLTLGAGKNNGAVSVITFAGAHR